MPVSSPNDPDISPPPSLHPSHQAFDDHDAAAHSSQGLLHKKKHVCTVCTRAFTTSGHLARHSRIHTGERNHKCPFPGCETRCSRQDNLQQHYRIHLSPGSRRNSGSATRAAMNRANVSSRPRSSRRRSANPTDPPDSPLSASPPAGPPPPPSPPLEPPPLVQAYPEPPDTPPPLAPAYSTAPVYPQHTLSAPDSSRSSRTTPEAAYAHAQLASAPPYRPPAGQYQTDELANSYPPSAHSSRASTSFGRSLDDGRWHSYPASEADRYSPVSPGHYADPISPVDSLGGHRGYGHGHSGDVQMSPQESAPAPSYFTQYARPPQNSASASPVSYPPSQSLPPSVSSHRHSIAHISHPNPGRQHSPSALSSNSASPVVSTPPTPGYGYVPMGGYTESPPESLSPVTPAPPPPPQQQPAPVVPMYSSYESSSLASAGYSHPPPAPVPVPTQQQQQQQQQQMGIGYDRTLPAPTLTHARDPQGPAHQHQQQLHFNYGQPAYASGGGGEMERYSPRPVLAPIQDGLRNGVRYASPQQSLVGVGRHPHSHDQQHQQQQQHAFAYHHQQQQDGSAGSTSTGSTAASASQAAYTHQPAYAHGSASSSASGYGNDGGYQGPSSSSSSASPSEYYYHPHAHPQQHQAIPSHAHPHTHREPSPEADGGEYGNLELHQPQPQRHGHGGGHGGYMQTGAGAAQAQGHVAHPVWRADEYARGRLVQ